MNADLVFTGFDKEGNEKLVYKKSDKYIDLIDNIELDSLDLETLRFLKETINVSKHIPKILIKKLYIKDRKKVIDTKKILVGRICRLTNLKLFITGYGRDAVYNYEWNNTFYEMDLYQSEGYIKKEYNNFKVYKNLYNGNKYIGYNKNIPRLSDCYDGFECVHFGEFITLKDVIKEPCITKKKLYEVANVCRKTNGEVIR